jgi:hypothetical protein
MTELKRWIVTQITAIDATSELDAINAVNDTSKADRDPEIVEQSAVIDITNEQLRAQRDGHDPGVMELFESFVRSELRDDEFIASLRDATIHGEVVAGLVVLELIGKKNTRGIVDIGKAENYVGTELASYLRERALALVRQTRKEH